jgi:hypothetical protein
MALVRHMHDAGLEHRDLNLGNLLVRPGTDGAGTEPFVIDLDRARLHSGPLPFRLRQGALRRLERSCVKLLGDAAPPGRIGYGPWYEFYAAGDRELEERFRRGVAAGHLWLRLHRAGWRKPRR